MRATRSKARPPNWPTFAPPQWQDFTPPLTDFTGNPPELRNIKLEKRPYAEVSDRWVIPLTEIQRNFPLLSNLRLGTDRLRPAAIPDLIFEIDQWFTDKDTGAAAFIIPSTYETALHVCLSMSLSLARRGFERRVEEHLRNGFEIGERVAVLPSGKIYEYDGYFELDIAYGARMAQRFLRLRLIDDKGCGSISFPENEIARLERTDKCRPAGRRGVKLDTFRTTVLDDFLGTRSGGNKDFFATDVFVITSPSKFERFVSGTTIERRDKPKIDLIESSRLLPWGKLRNDGTVSMAGGGEKKGRPLIAVAARLDPMMQYLAANPESRPRIVIDGAATAMGNPTVFADMVDRTLVAILAGFRDVPAIRNLRQQSNLEAFQVPPEKLASSRTAYRTAYAGVFQECLDAANNAVVFEAIEIDELTCRELDSASNVLSEAAECIESEELTADHKECLKSLFRILLRASNDVGSSSDGYIPDELKRVATKFSINKRFWPPETAKLLTKTMDFLSRIQSNERGPRRVKRDKIEAYLGGEISQDNEFKLKDRELLMTHGAGEKMILLTGWPGRRKLEEIVYRFRTERIVALAFGFEAQWFQNFNRRYRETELYSATRNLPYRPSEAGGLLKPLQDQRQIEDQHYRGHTSLEDLLNERPARTRKVDPGNEASVIDALHVEFADGRYAFLTRDHKVPVLLSFGRFEGESEAQVETLSASDLEFGQLCIFRQGSDGDAVRLFAEHRIGESKYNEIRKIATSWRNPLRGLATYPEITIGDRSYALPNLTAIIHILRNAGFDGVNQTVRNWITNPNMIGPGERLSLELIARTSGDNFLNENLDLIWNAITKIWSLHMQAGADLTKALLDELPDKIFEAGRHSGIFSLTFGDLDVVEIYEVAKAAEPVSVELTNRLLGETSF